MLLMKRVSPSIWIRLSERSRVVPSRDQVATGGGAPLVRQVNCRVSPSISTCGSASIMVAVGRTVGVCVLYLCVCEHMCVCTCVCIIYMNVCVSVCVPECVCIHVCESACVCAHGCVFV